MEKIRLDKILSESGLVSRKEASRLIKSGAVVVDGKTATAGDEKFDPTSSQIHINGAVFSYRKFHYLMMNKPAGYVSATEDRQEKTVLELLDGVYQRLGLFPTGRLDKDAEGLLLLTDDGDWAHRVISPSKKVDKVYYAQTEGTLGPSDVKAFEEGVVLKDGLHCLPAGLEIISTGETSVCLVTVREGKYHQVKRMLASRGNPVTYLRRIAVGGLALDASLAPGAYRELNEAEVNLVFSDVPLFEHNGESIKMKTR